MSKIKELVKKHWDVVSYLFFGVLTTLVSWITYAGFMLLFEKCGMNGEPVAHAKNKYHRIDRTYKDEKHITSEAWFDENGQPTPGPDGYYTAKHKYTDEALTETTFYDTDGETLINSKKGYARIVYENNSEKQDYQR